MIEVVSGSRLRAAVRFVVRKTAGLVLDGANVATCAATTEGEESQAFAATANGLGIVVRRVAGGRCRLRDGAWGLLLLEGVFHGYGSAVIKHGVLRALPRPTYN